MEKDLRKNQTIQAHTAGNEHYDQISKNPIEIMKDISPCEMSSIIFNGRPKSLILESEPGHYHRIPNETLQAINSLEKGENKARIMSSLLTALQDSNAPIIIFYEEQFVPVSEIYYRSV